MKLTNTRLMEIIKEEVIKEVSSDNQRRYMCAMKDAAPEDRPDGLSKAEAEEMCTGPMKEEEVEEGLFGKKHKSAKYSSMPARRVDNEPIGDEHARHIEELLKNISNIINDDDLTTPREKAKALNRARNLMTQAVFQNILKEEGQ